MEHDRENQVLVAGVGSSGHDRHACGSMRRRMPVPCELRAGWGTDHVGIGRCRKHGGMTRNHRVRAARIQSKQLVAAFGVARRDADPRDALAEEVARTLGAIDWLGAQLHQLSPSVVFGGDGQHPYMFEWRWERTHLRQLCRDVVGLGIADRGSRVAEQVGGLLVQVLDRLLDDLELNEVQRARLVEVVPAALRQITP